MPAQQPIIVMPPPPVTPYEMAPPEWEPSRHPRVIYQALPEKSNASGEQ
jgi:hypothetical protein